MLKYVTMYHKKIILTSTIIGIFIAFYFPNQALLSIIFIVLPVLIYSSVVIFSSIRAIIKKWRPAWTWWTAIIFTITFFLVKIKAAQHINYHFNIHISYIDNAAIILAVVWIIVGLASIILGITSIIFLVNFIISLIMSISLTINYNKNNDNIHFKRTMTSVIYLIIMFICGILIDSTSNISLYAVYTDSHSYSDCTSQNEKINPFISYIRKNDNECYQITSKSRFIPWGLKHEPVQAKKP